MVCEHATLPVMKGAGTQSHLLQRSRTYRSFATLSRRAVHPVLCVQSHATACSHAPRCSSRTNISCRVSSSRDAGDIPVVDATVLPPPPTGSQYAWRRSWAGAGASSSGSAGNGGTGGGSKGGRTRDWGGGRPGSGLLYILMYRMRLLLLYGAWVTVLYGAVHAVCDLSARIARTAFGIAGKASGWAAGHIHGTDAGHMGAAGSSSSAAAAGPAAVDATVAAGSTAAATEAEAGAASSSVEPAGGAQAAAQTVNDGSGSDGGSRFASISSRLQERPAAKLFNNVMACVIPLYLMLLGSVCFFASL